MIRISIKCFCSLLIFASSAQAQYHSQRDATVGGLTGAIAGSLIGDHNGNAGAGAVIGGVVGAVAGGLIGDAKDQQEWVQRRRQMIAQSSRNGSLITPQLSQTNNAVTNQDVLQMVQAGLSNQVIVNQINQRGIAQTLTVQEIINLHQQGVNETILTAMQTAKINRRFSQAPQAHLQNIPQVGSLRSSTTIWTSSYPANLPFTYRNYCPPVHQPYYHHYYQYRPRQNFGIHFRF